MEGETTEQDYKKFEALLGKISNETSENSLAEGFDHLLASEPITDNNSSSPQDAYRGNSMSSYHDLSCFRWLENNGMIDASVSNCETSACIAGLVNPYLVPQSLALSLEQLGLNDGEERVPSSPAPVTSLNGFSRYMLPSVLRSEEVSVPPYPVSLNGARPSNAALNGYSPFTGQEEYGRHNGMINQADAGFNQLNASEQVNQRSEALFDHLQSYPVCSTRMPVNPGMHRYQYLHGVPSQELEFRPSPSYLPRQYLGQFDRDWQNVGDEGYYRTSTPSLQDLQDGIHRVRNGTNGTGSFSGNMKHSYMMGTTPSQTGMGNLNTRWNDIPSGRGYYQQEFLCNGVYRYYPQELRVRNESCSQNFTYASGLTCSTKGSHRHQVSDKVGNQISPESILTRSYGVDSLRSLRSDSVISNRPRCYVDNYARDFSNGDSSLLLHRNRASDLDGQNSRNLSSDNYDFRHASKSFQLKFKSLDDVVGRIYTLARDQDGCRFLQNKFTEGTSEDVERIFAEIIDGIVELMTDPFGNYLVQKLFEVCNEDQRAHLLQRITRTTVNLIEISCNTHGSRAVQKIIETLKTKEQFSMIASSLESDALSLIKDINGTHVAQRCLQYLSPEYNEFLFNAATAHCVELATHRHGCCVLQKCFSHATVEQKCMLMSEITSNALVLSQDQFGNYVVQYILDQKVPMATASILDQLQGNYGSLSLQKYSSNVVEKCLKHAGNDQLAKIIHELMYDPQFDTIIQDQYGNYVIQSALRECKGTLRAALVNAIRTHLPSFHNTQFVRGILSSIYLKK